MTNINNKSKKNTNLTYITYTVGYIKGFNSIITKKEQKEFQSLRTSLKLYLIRETKHFTKETLGRFEARLKQTLQFIANHSILTQNKELQKLCSNASKKIAQIKKLLSKQKKNA